MAETYASDKDSNGIKWLAEVEDIPSKAEGDLAKEVLRRYNGAVLWQSTEMVNGRGLRDVLENCSCRAPTGSAWRLWAWTPRSTSPPSRSASRRPT